MVTHFAAIGDNSFALSGWFAQTVQANVARMGVKHRKSDQVSILVGGELVMGTHESFVRCQFESTEICSEAFKQAIVAGWRVSKPTDTVLLIFGLRND